jgi:uncharacterized protein (DUF433 family)
MDPIKVDREIMSGTPCFIGTRVPVKALFDYLGHGRPLDEFLLDFPSVERDQAVRVIGLAGEKLLAPLAASPPPVEAGAGR